MKKILSILFLFMLAFAVKSVKAEEIKIEYSEWSASYPSGLDEVFIESEDRYKWYKFENNEIVYVDDYYANLDGYTKDEASKVTFYRYITNSYLIFDSHNNLVLNPNYCLKNFCYIKNFTNPQMVDTLEKFEPDYENTPKVEYNSEVSPFTGDTILHSIVMLLFSVIALSLIVIKKVKMNKKSIFVE